MGFMIIILGKSQNLFLKNWVGLHLPYMQILIKWAVFTIYITVSIYRSSKRNNIEERKLSDGRVSFCTKKGNKQGIILLFNIYIQSRITLC